MRLSIIIPVLNEAETIAARLDALQTLGVGVQYVESVVGDHAACVGMLSLVWQMRLSPST